MINYKSFNLPGKGKLRVRSDRIVGTVTSKTNAKMTLYVDGISEPLYIPIDEGALSSLIDYVWERNHVETEED